MATSLPPLVQKFLDKFSNSRDFTISFTLHTLLIAIFGGSVLIQAVHEPEDFQGGKQFVENQEIAPVPRQSAPSDDPSFDVTSALPTTTVAGVPTITTDALDPREMFSVPLIVLPGPSGVSMPKVPSHVAVPVLGDGLTPAAAAGLRDFSESWRDGPKGPGVGLREREFEFTAYLGQYNGGDWDSTVRVVRNKIETGSLPNLLYVMSAWSKDKIKTNYQNVQAIKLDSDEIFVVKPPFIFLTGTQDFVLTEKEVENLRKYVRLGGCIWGDSSLPGLRSRFDLAFRREMRRVIGDVDKEFEPLPENHPIFTKNYFPEIKGVPPGLNYYQEKVYALKMYGEVAILYTANDYGDQWQVGLNADGQIDLRRDQNGRFVAVNDTILRNKGVYLRNLDETSLKTSFRFGTNVVMHLLTRWDRIASSAPAL